MVNHKPHNLKLRLRLKHRRRIYQSFRRNATEKITSPNQDLKLFPKNEVMGWNQSNFNKDVSTFSFIYLFLSSRGKAENDLIWLYLMWKILMISVDQNFSRTMQISKSADVVLGYIKKDISKEQEEQC